LKLLEAGIDAVERGLISDLIVRIAIRRLCGNRARAFEKQTVADTEAQLAGFTKLMCDGPIAPLAEKANQQHYEIPAEFFATVLGPHRKYSCCLWPHANTTLAEAEEAALAMTCERAQLTDGQKILELGCGWGSLSLWMAMHYPHSQITAVSNSVSQRLFIETEAATRGLTNLRVITADMNDFVPPAEELADSGLDGKFDRVVSVEMFEHMRNYALLFERIASWLRPDGKCFIHIFCHRRMAYAFETDGAVNWMGRYFFSGGLMPSRDLPDRFQRHLKVVGQWDWNGQHYFRTSEAWLENFDKQRSKILPILESTYGTVAASRWLNRWRVFFLAVSELFACRGGEEWFVTHCLLERNQ
jgi:cyclopropane-fatty-acyl-phospholipid synthase